MDTLLSRVKRLTEINFLILVGSIGYLVEYRCGWVRLGSLFQTLERAKTRHYRPKFYYK
ncbi:hypothetical protein HanIR_Chr13g0639801 [Helianthus annuus]|nr:hypothetical protein HanIR_Chr13g0639801 [Helianthus annuus]